MAFLLLLLEGSMEISFYQLRSASSDLTESLTPKKQCQSQPLAHPMPKPWIRPEYRRIRARLEMALLAYFVVAI